MARDMRRRPHPYRRGARPLAASFPHRAIAGENYRLKPLGKIEADKSAQNEVNPRAGGGSELLRRFDDKRANSIGLGHLIFQNAKKSKSLDKATATMPYAPRGSRTGIGIY